MADKIWNSERPGSAKKRNSGRNKKEYPQGESNIILQTTNLTQLTILPLPRGGNDPAYWISSILRPAGRFKLEAEGLYMDWLS